VRSWQRPRPCAHAGRAAHVTAAQEFSARADACAAPASETKVSKAPPPLGVAAPPLLANTTALPSCPRRHPPLTNAWEPRHLTHTCPCSSSPLHNPSAPLCFRGAPPTRLPRTHRVTLYCKHGPISPANKGTRFLDGKGLLTKTSSPNLTQHGKKGGRPRLSHKCRPPGRIRATQL
jgi:hypothetical protein